MWACSAHALDYQIVKPILFQLWASLLHNIKEKKGSGLKSESQSESILYLYSDLKVPIVMVALEQHLKDTS